MLIGNNPLSLPRYDAGRLPAVVTVRCHCGARFAVFTGAAGDAHGAQLVERESLARGMAFVDARAEPFKACSCGMVLDFSNVPECSAVM